ncbi:MAG: type II toxin-antitoxin system VapC family toxin [Mobiluncus porci]|uniref:type II toxin-antitoxin system VapC family toxin n=1 Tax=Mobiluncus porci TaxID=2652278 RepID=UPI0023F2D523|nr:type II toxin-antitoxin system VapC family toxin [Mobiluncus porci]MDD7542509.1 type II toxin-antitoxin system VapC family toxin [Mobiluncus porci]MDY5748806.1 type II toxin-antitoxin system VapC family toxin [Mobiluncus porci]
MTSEVVLNRMYVDTSAFTKLIVEEAESVSLAHFFDETRAELVMSRQTYTEFYCMIKRRAIKPENWESMARQSFNQIKVFPVQESDYLEAAASEWHLRGADAIHLAVALRLGCDAMAVFDAELAEAARARGLEVPSF